jgi:hypothetical protein
VTRRERAAEHCERSIGRAREPVPLAFREIIGQAQSWPDCRGQLGLLGGRGMDVSRNAPRALVAAVLVALVLLPGVMVVVDASSAVPSQSAPGDPQVDAEFEASIVVTKFIDADGNLDTVVDQKLVAWEFELATDGTITDDAGDNRWTVSYGSTGAFITLTEVAREGFALLGAFCVEPTSGYSVGELKGHSLTVELQVVRESAEYVCEFVNAPIAVESVGGGTGTPPSNTLPPTDSGGHASTPTSDSRLVIAAIFAGILAASLVSFPSFGTRRPASGKR